MSEQHELEVVAFVDGPAAGQRGEIPVDYDEVWRYVRGAGYCLYRRGPERAMTFAGEVCPPEALADRLAAEGLEPWLHVDERVPRARRVHLVPGEMEDR